MGVKWTDEKKQQERPKIPIAGLDAGFDEKSRRRSPEEKTGLPR